MSIEHIKGGCVTILLVYVDNIVVNGNDEIETEGLRDCVTREHEIK